MRPLLVSLFCVGCVGNIQGPSVSPVDPTSSNPQQNDPDPKPVDLCEGITVAAAPASLRRLTVAQLSNSWHDAMKDASAPLDLAPAAGPIITELEVEKVNLAARSLVSRKGHAAYARCNLDGPHDSACAAQFIADFALAVYRRPLEPAEQAALKAEVYDAVRTNPKLSPPATFRECIDAVAEVILQSPDALYLHEVGVADAALAAGTRRLSGHERASRLSYLLWNTAPDAALLATAKSGALDTAEGVRAEATRLLADPRARSAVRGVVSSWLELDGSSHQPSLDAVPKDKTRFPFDSPALRTAMREELLALYERAFFDLNGSFQKLMTTNQAYVNRSLGTLYGVTAGLPANDSTSAWVELNPTERAGLFTRAGFLALYAPQLMQSPIRRGVFLYRNALGRVLAPPPPNVDNTPLKPNAGALTVRQQVETRTSPAQCQACHARINPLGFTLESYDAIGRYQTEERGTLDGAPYTAPIDATATLVGSDIAGEVKGPIDLSARLAASAQAHDAMVAVWYARANERAAVPNDACNLQRLEQRFRETDDMRDLLVSLVAADSTLFLLETP